MAFVLLLLVPIALADTAPIPNDGSLPWSDPNHQTPLETLAGQIASRIANRQVTIRCEGNYDWQLLVGRLGLDPSSELGYVGSHWYSTSALQSIDSFAELQGGICLTLMQFAVDEPKPTKCSPLVTQQTTVYKAIRVRATVRVRVNGKWHRRTVWRTRTIPTKGTEHVPGPLQPCYSNGIAVAGWPSLPSDFWTSYWNYAQAILVLAHESIHLGGAVGGVFANGVHVGDQQAEAHANCYGLQWMPYVAEQLGDTPDDAQAIAEYAWDRVYPSWKGTPYWSADCVPGGAMDTRPPGSTLWP